MASSWDIIIVVHIKIMWYLSGWAPKKNGYACMLKKYVATNGALYATENLVTDKEPMWVFEASTLPPHPSPSHSLHFFGFLFSLVAASLFLPVHICCCFGVVMHDLCTNFANAAKWDPNTCRNHCFDNAVHYLSLVETIVLYRLIFMRIRYSP